jgi:hypothetical protein
VGVLRLNVGMPRKKTIQPQPIEIQDYGYMIVELYGSEVLPTGRGLHARYKREATFAFALEVLWQAKEDAKRGIRRQQFANFLNSANKLAVEVERKHPNRHSKSLMLRICRAALSLYALTGDDNVRKQYLDLAINASPNPHEQQSNWV